jgi:hypothetical protein
MPRHNNEKRNGERQGNGQGNTIFPHGKPPTTTIKSACVPGTPVAGAMYSMCQKQAGGPRGKFVLLTGVTQEAVCSSGFGIGATDTLCGIAGVCVRQAVWFCRIRQNGH